MRFAWRLSAIGIVLISLAASAVAASSGEFQFHHDQVLGTSLDLTVWGSQAQAEQAEKAVLDEIERLRRILSTYDPASEISRLGPAPMRCSGELIGVLGAYELWDQRSGGAYTAHLGDLIRAWKQAQRTQTLPDEAVLSALVDRVAQPAWRIDRAAGTVARLTSTPLSVDSLGKGYIITRAIEAARAAVPGLNGVMLNIGGDIRVWSRADRPISCLIGIADPKQPFDNALPVTRVRLANAAISTSAAYERGYDIGGRHYSHILDPRTGRPASGVASATVIAEDNITANALATTLCVLSPEEGLRLVERSGAQCLIIATDGRQVRSAGFAAIEVPIKQAAVQGAVENGWPKGFQVSIAITLKSPAATGRRRPARPYVAVWVENEKGQPVRSITVWGNEREYLKDLPEWWKFAKDQPEVVKAVTRATRPAGRYRVVWDGLDDAGKPVGQGSYRICLEANRERGRHVLGNATIACGADKATAAVKASAKWEEAQISYGPQTEQP